MSASRPVALVRLVWFTPARGSERSSGLEGQEGRVGVVLVVRQDIEAPLAGEAGRDHAIRPAGPGNGAAVRQGRVGAHALVEQERAGYALAGAKLLVMNVTLGRSGGGDGRVGERQRVGHLAVAAGDDQRVILHHVRALGGDGVDVDAAGNDGDGVVGGERRRER